MKRLVYGGMFLLAAGASIGVWSEPATRAGSSQPAVVDAATLQTTATSDASVISLLQTLIQLAQRNATAAASSTASSSTGNATGSAVASTTFTSLSSLPNPYGGLVIAGAYGGPLAVPTALPVVFATASINTSAGRSFSYPMGWNLIGGPTGLVLSNVVGPLYSLNSTSTAYIALDPAQPLQGGVGYWAFFGAVTQQQVPNSAPTGAVSIGLPAGRYVQVGNPLSQLAVLSGADVVYTFGANGYTPTVTLAPGEGALAFSYAGGALTFTPAAP